jgi:hypothetical protein
MKTDGLHGVIRTNDYSRIAAVLCVDSTSPKKMSIMVPHTMLSVLNMFVLLSFEDIYGPDGES